MTTRFLLRLVGISLALSLILETFIIWGVRTLNERGEGPLRVTVLHIVGRLLERSPDYSTGLATFNGFRHTLGLSPMVAWVTDQNGRILASTPPSQPLPLKWGGISPPDKIHGISVQYHFLELLPYLALLRLSRPEPTYLLLELQDKHLRRIRLEEESLILFLSMVASAFSGILFTFLLLREKSLEARRVIASLTQGDLGARFSITRLDEVGELMTLFNRMAETIEDLVIRIQKTDLARRDLLEELGHDLRTPLTSLKTAAETLLHHGPSMAADEHGRFARIILEESRYLGHMIEDLFFIAEMEAPEHRKDRKAIDLTKIIKEGMELSTRSEEAKNKRIRWEYQGESDPQMVGGDPLLFRRLFQNAFQNAVRHTTSRIAVITTKERGPSGNSIKVRIIDDGPGISSNTIAAFGVRRSTRSSDPKRSESRTSLGLGSVIIVTVAQLYGGTVQIRRLSDQEASTGTELSITFPTIESPGTLHSFSRIEEENRSP
ncbi:MAG: HAMP domain-containing sensor histidine kinase [Nitrospiraceae bacterium]|nr:HAMP domain-containing sensor histidine kinase [Nitrospiraceae bacterium]